MQVAGLDGRVKRLVEGMRSIKVSANEMMKLWGTVGVRLYFDWSIRGLVTAGKESRRNYQEIK